MIGVRFGGLVVAGIMASDKNHHKQHRRSSAIDPRVVRHGGVGGGKAPKGLGGSLGVAHSPVAEVNDRLVQGAAAAANDEHALRRNG